MNSLSWMIYLASVSNDAQGYLGFAAVSGPLAGAALAISHVCMKSGEPTFYSWHAKDARTKMREAYDAKVATFAKWSKRLFAVGAASAIAVTFIPAKETIYAITASEMGEEVLNSKTAGKAMKALDAWLDRQIASETPTK